MRTKKQIRRNRRIALLLILVFCTTLISLGCAAGYQVGRADVSTVAPDAELIAEPATSEELIPAVPVIQSGGRTLPPEIVSIMIEMSDKHSVPLALIIAMAEQESGFNPDAVSKTNDHGLMQINQINHGWLRQKGIDPMTTKGNIEASCYIISEAIKNYTHYNMALMAYNCGDAGAAKLWKRGIYSTTYSKAVMEKYAKWDEYLKGA